MREAARRYDIPLADWLDLSTGIAPWPFPLPAIPEQAWTRLPESDDGLEAAACLYYGAERVLPLAGSQAAIQALPRLRRGGGGAGLRARRAAGLACPPATSRRLAAGRRGVHGLYPAVEPGGL